MNRRIAPTSLFIKRFMKENNVSQKKLSELTGYTEKQISLILNDKTNVTKKFAQGLSESIDGLDADPPYALGSEIIIRKDGKVDYANVRIKHYKENEYVQLDLFGGE